MTSNRFILLTAVVLRLVLSAFFLHPDLKSQYFHAQYLSHGVINIYEFLDKNRQRLPYSDTFNYPPLIYFFQGTWLSVAKLVTGPGLIDWINNWGPQAANTPGIFSYLLILKLPYLIADLAVLYFLRLLSPDGQAKKRLTWIWLFNPISLYAIYQIGQFDVLPTLLTICALCLAIRQKLGLSGLFIGLAAAFKTYPLLLLPLLFFCSPRPTDWLKISFSAGLGFGLPLLPFINSVPFFQSVFQSSLGSRLFSMQVPLIQLPAFPIFYGLILFMAFHHRRRSLIWSFAAITLASLIFTEFHAQWLVWCLPFICFFLALYTLRFVLPAVGLFTGFLCYIALLRDQFVFLGLFDPVNPYLSSIPPFVSFVPHAEVFSFFARSLFLISGLFFIFKTYAFFTKPN